MTSALDKIHHFFNDYADKRTSEWPLISSPVPILIILASYLYFVTKCGPDYMRHRKPYQLKTVISLYNIGQVVSCIWVVYELFASGWWNDYSLGCQPVDISTNPKPMRMANVSWWVILLKMSELLETVFFVLRKKQNQVTILHLYHHVSTLMIAYVCTKYTPGGMGTFPIIPNCMVHVLMYSYYLVSLHASTELQKKLNKWKRYLTLVQMLQFCVILIHSFQGLMPSCDFNKGVAYMFIPNVFLVFYLFYDFYKKAYSKKE